VWRGAVPGGTDLSFCLGGYFVGDLVFGIFGRRRNMRGLKPEFDRDNQAEIVCLDGFDGRLDGFLSQGMLFLLNFLRAVFQPPC